jgi:hypothetical protein
LRIEHSRKHGPFDSRYSPIRHKPAPVSLWRLGEERTDWQGFLARFYPGCRRHDFDALAAYESYCNGAEGRRADDSLVLRSLVHVARSENARSAGDGEEPPAVAETERWEGEGGATGRLRRHEGVSDVPRDRGFSGDKPWRVGEGVDSTAPTITVLLVAARPVNLFK